MKTKTIALCVALFFLLETAANAGQIAQVPRTWTKLTGTNSAKMTEWIVFALQTPGEPVLHAQVISNDCVKVHWPSAETNYSLVVATNRAQMIFRSPAESIQSDGTNRFILTRPRAGLYYYQLQRNR